MKRWVRGFDGGRVWRMYGTGRGLVGGVVDELVGKLAVQQEKEPLIATIFEVFNGNIDLLGEMYGFCGKRGDFDGIGSDKDDIWQALVEDADGTRNVRKKRAEMMLKGNQHVVPQMAYNRFLKALYPVKLGWRGGGAIGGDVLANFVKYQSLDHDLVYRRYQELPQPAMSYMKPQHLQDFVSRFLYRRDFVRPNDLSGSYGGNARLVYGKFVSQVQKRRDHLYMCTRVLQDMREAELPISWKEQHQILFMTFFKDRRDILDRVGRAIHEFKQNGLEHITFDPENHFDWHQYCKIKSQLLAPGAADPDSSINTYNLLLFLAIRHDQHAIIHDIMQDLQLSPLLQELVKEQKVALSLPANRKTFELLLGYFSSNYYISQSMSGKTAFANTIRYLNACPHLACDIETVNTVVKGLVNFGYMAEAENLVTQLFTNRLLPNNELRDQLFSEEFVVYKRLTAEDKMAYSTFLGIYDKLTQVLGNSVEPFRLIPDETTYRTLVKGYCTSTETPSFAKVAKLMETMEQLGFPLTTRTYITILQRFIQVSHCRSQYGEWNYHQLNYTTAKILSWHDKLYASTNDMPDAQAIESMGLNPNLGSALVLNLEHLKIRHIPKDRGNFLKLTDTFINLLCQAHIDVINSDDSLMDDRKRMVAEISSARDQLFGHIKELRKLGLTNVNGQLGVNDEIIYIKKSFIIDLLDLGNSVSAHQSALSALSALTGPTA